MKFKKENHRLLKSILCILVFLPLFTFANNSNNPDDDQSWYRRKFSLTLHADGTFTNTDTSLTVFQEGTYELKEKEIVFLGSKTSDSISHSEAIPILYHTDKKLSFEKNGKKITYLDENKTLKPGLSASSFFRGLLGMFSLVLIAFLFSKNRKRINWKLVIKGIILQIVLALLILKVTPVEIAFDFISNAFVKVVDMAHEGAIFVFGSVVFTSLITFLVNLIGGINIYKYCTSSIFFKYFLTFFIKT